jgi:hypothetical protein
MLLSFSLGSSTWWLHLFLLVLSGRVTSFAIFHNRLTPNEYRLQLLHCPTVHLKILQKPCSSNIFYENSSLPLCDTVTGQVVPDSLTDHSAFPFSVKQSKNSSSWTAWPTRWRQYGLSKSQAPATL